MSHPHPRFCPLCGQDIVVPNEFMKLRIESSQMKVFALLYRRMGTIVNVGVALELKHTTARVYICKIREAIEDSGLPLIIRTVRSQGFRMEKIDETTTSA